MRNLNLNEDKKRDRERERERQTDNGRDRHIEKAFHLMAYSPNAHISQDYDRLKPEAWNSICVSHMVGGTHILEREHLLSLKGHSSRKLESKAELELKLRYSDMRCRSHKWCENIPTTSLILLTKLTVIALNSFNISQNHSISVIFKFRSKSDTHYSLSKIFLNLHHMSSTNFNITSFIPKIFTHKIKKSSFFRISHAWDLGKIFVMRSSDIHAMS